MQMPRQADDMSSELPCYRCGYDLRAHPADGKCPECEAPVAESRRMALIPLRPAWRDSDPRWRRRVLLGLWILVLMPVVDVLKVSGWVAHIPVPTVYHFPDSNRMLNESFLCEMRTDQPLLFCIGAVLLFARERGRPRYRLDWTRRWGVICSYVAWLLSMARVIFAVPIPLVAMGIGCMFLSMRPKFQPWFTDVMIKVSTACVNHGPTKPIVAAILAAFSSIAILLACVPLYHALRSSYPKRLKVVFSERIVLVFIAPLALFALLHLAQAGLYCIGSSGMSLKTVSSYVVYFRPQVLIETIQSRAAGVNVAGWNFVAAIMEGAKWCTVLAIAIWLSIAQAGAWGRAGR